MKNIAYIFAVSVILFTACSDDGAKVVEAPELEAGQSRAAEALNDFDIDFFEAMSEANKGDNLVVSPMSASMLLSYIANVTDRETAEQICSALGCSDLKSLNELAQKYGNWMPVADSKVKVCIAYSVWYHNAYTLNPVFDNIGSEYYKAQSFARDFGQGLSVADQINKWASDKTKGLINKVIDGIPANNPAILLNAMYFKGEWTDKFDKKETENETFHGELRDNTVKMMYRESHREMAVTPEYQLVRQTFSKKMYYVDLILPAEGTGIDEFIASGALKTIKSVKLTDKNFTLGLPKFKIEPDKELKLTEVLSEIGIDNLKDARIKGLFTQDISAAFDLCQYNTLEFDENGATAASVTRSDLDMAPQPDMLVFDRPFVALIKEAMTDRILFAAKIVNL